MGCVGARVGVSVGNFDGTSLGTLVGEFVGVSDGTSDGARVGVFVGGVLGKRVGTLDGIAVGESVGAFDGEFVWLRYHVFNNLNISPIYRKVDSSFHRDNNILSEWQERSFNRYLLLI